MGEVGTMDVQDAPQLEDSIKNLTLLPSSASHLCQVCQSIDFKGILISHESSWERKDKKEKSPLGYLDEVIAKASSCQFCDLLVQSAKRVNSGEAPPVEYQGQRVQVYLTPRHLCRLVSDTISTRNTLWISRLEATFEPAIFGYFSGIRLQIYEEPSILSGLGRLVNPVVDITRLKGWLQLCEESHGDVCHNPSWLGDGAQPSILKVIDVEKKCVILAPPDCRYLALSYVWGDRQNMKSDLWHSSSANTEVMEKEGGLKMDLLPRTITDAMKLVSRIGERYLWVDALCIAQDDEVALSEQTAQMDLVYARALLTIIVACGNNSGIGLPGLDEGTREIMQSRVKVTEGNESYSIGQTVAQGNANHLQHSAWNQRGWTFQERRLSRRALIFTKEQVFWQCESHLYDEETILEEAAETSKDVAIHILQQALDCCDEWDDKIAKFSRTSLGTYVTQYSTRQFSYPSDALAAFLGILRRMEYENKEKYHWGLPHTRFDQALNWSFGNARRQEFCRLMGQDGVVYYVRFPSWSWVGWQGFMGGPPYNWSLHDRTLRGLSKSELQFYKVDSGGRAEPIVDPTPGTRPDHEFPEPNENATVQEYPLRDEWKGNTTIDSSTTIPLPNLPKIPVSPNTEGNEDHIPPFLDTGLLAFYTSYATIQCQYDLSYRSGGRRDQELTVHLPTGTIHLDLNQGAVTDYFERVLSMPIPPDEPTATIPLDFIVISRHCAIAADVESEKLNLLIVKFDEDKNVAERLGGVVMSEKDWVSVVREWKLVILA